MGKAIFGVTSESVSQALVNLSAMSDEKQIHPLLAHGKVIDHAIIPDTKPKRVCALQSVVRHRCQLPPQRINRLGNPDPHPG